MAYEGSYAYTRRGMMRLTFGTRVLIGVAVLLASPVMFFARGVAEAEGEQLKLVSSDVVSEFPEGIRFKASVESPSEIVSIAVRLRIGQQTRGVYEYLEVINDDPASFELFWRTNTGARYIPPGTIVTYNFEVEDVDGNRLDTEKELFIYEDVRFTWNEVSEGPITLAFHGPVETRARLIMDAIIRTLEIVGPVLGADTTEPIRVTMYNNIKEMLEALPPGSTTIRRELITEGQAFTNVGTLLVLGSGGLAEGTASHEVTHILTHRAGDSVFRNVPAWLDEGLSEYGNVQPGFSYSIALEFAVARDALFPIAFMPVLPGNPEDVIIFYGQARSIVRFMIGRYGPEEMTELMAALKSGANMDDALEGVYGFDRLGLENRWREWLGAPEYVPPVREQAQPTAVARREFLPYSLTPQAQSATVSGVESTPTPEPTATATPAPSPTPEPAFASSLAASSPTPPAGGVEATRDLEDDESREEGGGACSVPSHGSFKVRDVSSFGLVLGLVALGFRRRLGR